MFSYVVAWTICWTNNRVVCALGHIDIAVTSYCNAVYLQQSSCVAATSYHVSVKTGDVRGAGTDANVTLKIFGDKGDTGDLALQASENNKNKFERGRTDLFKPEASDIGKVGHVDFIGLLAIY